jgi:hypothetical protein
MALDRGADAERDHRHAVLRARRTIAATSSVLCGNTTASGGVTGYDEMSVPWWSRTAGGGRDAVAEHRAQRVEQRRRERRVRARPQRGEVAAVEASACIVLLPTR